ncbi:MAG: transglycosylase SLT domain-containing protein [Gammaproteobacteria bacterium]|nr:transglycosylase SLT domain-containing protein [Gammaproteobacteria bacterium]
MTAALSAAVSFPVAASESLERQRALFVAALKTAETGDWSTVDNLAVADRALLENYELWPDLRAAYFRATIRQTDSRTIERFLERHGALKPARELRYRLAMEYVRRGDLDSYLDIYRSYYQGLGSAKLDCLAFQAEIANGRGARIIIRAKERWLVGQSQVDECDPVFEFLQQSNRLTQDDYRTRYALAIEAREFSLARWLGKSINEDAVAQARNWMAAQSNPESFLRSYASGSGSDMIRSQLAYAAERLTYRDPQLALELWNDAAARQDFTAEQSQSVLRHIALWTARDNLPGAHELLVQLPVEAQDAEVMRWRARVSLRETDWAQLLADIAAMPAKERSTEEWRYWRAVALGRSGQVNAAIGAFEALAKERSYYGFLAADEIDLDYAFEHDTLTADRSVIDAIAARPAMRRARELFFVGLDSRGRSEWDAAVSVLSPEEKVQAALLADRWGWHSRAISTVASIGEYNDLSLRYPLPFKNAFEQYAGTASISPTWAYGIARSESLFMRDIRSSAGAIGLMQLMPATGRAVARDIKLRYAGLDTLTDHEKNIRLGTAYLGQMVQRFDGNPVLATAAYNAGPHRVDQWMPASGSVDARVWIENIPFNETRKYVRRVMAADAIFHWRLTGTTQRLSDTLAAVNAPAKDQRVASAAR